MMSASEVMIFRPTMGEFRNFNEYVKYMESKGALREGIAKIVPPAEWAPRKTSYSDDDVANMVIPGPLRQTTTGERGEFGVFRQSNVPIASQTVAEYRRMAESGVYATPVHGNYDDLERKYWKTIAYGNPIYGAGVSGTLFDDTVDVWNVNRLGTILDCLHDDDHITIEGVNTPFLYFGMWKSSFAWHVEDMDLYSVNYLHEGAPKTWYAIPEAHGRRFESVVAKLFPYETAKCPAFLRHKTTVLSPKILKKHSIPYSTVTQNRGEFIISFPYGYHSGFNHGFNIAEAINFASPRWIEYGNRASQCVCQNNLVTFSMDTFVKGMVRDSGKSS